MKVKVILICLICLSLSCCRTLKNNENNYKELEVVEQIVEKESLEEEKKTVNTKQESEIKTASISEKTEFFPPTIENPNGGAPKLTVREIYLTDEKLINETIESFEKKLSERDFIIESLERNISSLENQIIKTDSRVIQGHEWLWVGIAALIFILFFGSIVFFYVKRKIGFHKLSTFPKSIHK